MLHLEKIQDEDHKVGKYSVQQHKELLHCHCKVFCHENKARGPNSSPAAEVLLDREGFLEMGDKKDFYHA